MSHTATLRTLLAEAKEMILGFGEAECYEHECGVCGPIDDLTSKIDAALAEPEGDEKMSDRKPCTARCDSQRLTTDEAREALEQLLVAVREHPDLARQLAVLLRVAVEK